MKSYPALFDLLPSWVLVLILIRSASGAPKCFGHGILFGHGSGETNARDMKDT